MTARDTQFEEWTIRRFHAALLTRELTASELVDRYLARIEAHNDAGAEIHAVVTVNPRAREEAAAADELLNATGSLTGPLHGVPVLVKDQAETAGLRTSFGSILFADYVPATDATVITKLKRAGAIILAKTAMCDFAAGWFSSSSITGHTKNPYDPARDSGGSSAGTAAGVAANFGLVGIGEDTGGSIRIPASYNNLFGLRVTTGLISRTGFSPLVHFQDTPGPIARTVCDLAQLLDSIVGHDPLDPFTATASATPSRGWYARALESDVPLASWRLGVLETGFGPDENPDAAPVNQAVRTAIAHLEKLGVPTTPGLEIDGLSSWIAATYVYDKQAKSDITRFLASRPGAPVSSFMAIYDSKQFHPYNDLFHAIAAGPDTTDDDPEYLRLRCNQKHFRRLLLNLFAAREIDFLVYPTVQVIPPTREELAAAKYRSSTFPTNTVIASHTGLPALTIPVGLTERGLPVGMELLGSPHAEANMLQFAYAWERSTRPRRPPDLHRSIPTDPARAG
ncbi:MAG: amidase [Solirubrobacterales bacterium]|nr:amidase [Solirubrobacterales bacterium]